MYLGWLAHDRGGLDEAREWFERAVAAEPSCAEAHFALANVLLLQGDLERGWGEYEWRWQSASLALFIGVKPSSLEPRWHGEDFHGQAILLHAEQGYGDTLQFARYIPLVAERGGRVILGAQPELKRLLKSVDGVDEVRAAGEGLCCPEPLVHAAFGSLPHIFGTTLDNIPSAPYLRAEPELVDQWAREFAGERRLKVGLVWSGGPFNQRDRDRSIPLAELAPLGSVEGVAWYSLQIGLPWEVVDLQTELPLVDLGSRIRDFAETAAVMTQLDLVITVDTASAHLAGGLGRPVWVLLSRVPDWRWLMNRNDSPWYPMARLFRQRRRGDWQPVISAVGGALRNLLARA